MSALSTSNYAHDRFNGLPSIESADATMRKHGRLDTALAVLGPVFLRHNMHEKWGISILHRHWSLGADELPIQQVTQPDSPREFEMSPCRTDSGKTIAALTIAVSTDPDSPLQPMEFSTDPLTVEANQLIAAKPDFVRESCDTLLKYELDSTFGLSAVKQPSGTEYELVEFNSEHSSILKESTQADTNGMKLIQTSWRFSPDETGMACVGSCFSKCVLPSGGGAHYHEHPHAHNPNG